MYPINRMLLIRVSGPCSNSVWTTGIPVFDSASIASAGKNGLVTTTSGACATIVSGSREISAMSWTSEATLEYVESFVTPPTPTNRLLGTSASVISSCPIDAVMIRSGLAGMLTSPFSPSTSRGQPMLSGSTIPRTPSSGFGSGVGDGAGVAVGAGAVAVGTAVGSGMAVGGAAGAAVGAEGTAVGAGDSDEHAASASASSRASGTARMRSCPKVIVTPLCVRVGLTTSRPGACSL